MEINEAANNWTHLGEEDPMWAILSGKEKKGNKWSKDEFFATGLKDIQEILRQIQAAGLSVKFGTALDFGCGLGRLSQALAARFAKVHGVDVSQSMIEQARQHNAFGDAVTYHLNVRTDLGLFAGNQFDFICSLIVLQHIPARHQVLYIADFMDLLAPGGVAYFQTIHARALRALAPNWLVERYRKVKHGGKSFIPMYGVAPSTVQRIIRSRGCALDKLTVAIAEDAPRFYSNIFLVSKKAA